MTTLTLSVPSEWRHQWPCSTLAGHTVRVTLADNGDLVDLETAAAADLEAAELDAALATYGGNT